MRVLYILSSTSILGGSTKSFIRTTDGLLPKGVEMFVVCPDKGPAYQHFLKKGIPLRVIKNRFHVYPRKETVMDSILYYPKLLFHYFINFISYCKLLNICKENQIDIIHTNVSVVNIGAKVAKKMKLPHIFHVREYQDSDFDMKMIPSRESYVSLMRQNYCICITKGIQSHFGLKSSNSKVIYNGIKYKDEFCYIPDKKNYFLFVGRVDPTKGFDRVLKGYLKYHSIDTSIKLYVAGMFLSDSFETKTKQLITESNAEEDVIFLGPRDDINALLQRARACIIGSPNEAFGLVMVEAMFNGCLVCVYNTCGSHEQLDNASKMGYPSIAFPYLTTEELSKVLFEISCNDPDRYKKMVYDAGTVVKKLYSIEENGSKIFDYYQEILRKS